MLRIKVGWQLNTSVIIMLNAEKKYKSLLNNTNKIKA